MIQPAPPHPDTLTEEDFAALAYILGSYVGQVLKRQEEGKATQTDLEHASTLTKNLLNKLNALRDTM